VKRLRILWQRQPVVLSAFLIAAALALFFAVRAVSGAIYWATHSDEAVKGWMTPGYVERSWDLPRKTLAGPLDLKPLEPGQHPQNLRELALARGMTEAEMIALVEAEVAKAQARKHEKP
jgi:hypothetical protein